MVISAIFKAFPLQNSLIDVLVTEGGNIVAQQTGLWSAEAKV
jgi:hypothetical protein